MLKQDQVVWKLKNRCTHKLDIEVLIQFEKHAEQYKRWRVKRAIKIMESSTEGKAQREARKDQVT